MQKRVAAIHDISCFGKCSLTVALPILSAAGIETSVIPTAVLSTHTGGFTGFTYRDLTEDILPVVSHWQTLPITFDALYTGFLGSFEQIDLMLDVFRRLKTKDTLVLVDPVMADHGELYKIFPKNFPEGMRKLCAAADCIVPNMTEAALLLGEPYQEGPYTEEYVTHLIKRLSDLGPKRVVLTGVYFESTRLGAAAYDARTGQIDFLSGGRIEGMYHGTGDVFASALLSGMLHGMALADAAQLAVDFTVGSIARTRAANTDIRFGVNFEEGIPMLIDRLGLN
ncbi:MAG TPA: pyridoxamine kinase [Feifaniaceae bacterium]|nr:pyridoxamine kinase [Feifaniaceae bacterium]